MWCWAIVWGAALVGVALMLFWPDAPRWLSVTLYLLLGWVGVWYTGLILHNAGVAATVLLAVGGVLYSLGALLTDSAGRTRGRRHSVITRSFMHALHGSDMPLRRGVSGRVLMDRAARKTSSLDEHPRSRGDRERGRCSRAEDSGAGRKYRKGA